MKLSKKIFIIALLLLHFSSGHSFAAVYKLDIARETVNKTGKPVSKITVNGTIPGPTLYFKEGEDVTIHVTNHMKELTSVHWHGILLSGDMDGVPGLNGFKGIKPGETFTYNFKIRQSGTYWYHAHSNSQEQDGHYGSIVITPKSGEKIKADRDYVILLSDFSEEDSHTIFNNLKMDSGYYNNAKRTIRDFYDDIKNKGFVNAWENRKGWGEMKMDPTDLADVTGYTFLVNGKNPDQNWTGIFKTGETIRLRFINASSMSIYDVRIPDLKMKLVAADGQDVEPVDIDEFRFGVAETYDVIVEPKESKAYTIVAEPIDRTGFALGTLAPEKGMRGDMPEQRSRTLLTMADMGMEMDHSGMSMEDMRSMDMSDMTTGWDKAGTPEGHKALKYSDLKYPGIQKDKRQSEREIAVTLGGNMERYIWTLNGKKMDESEPININYGERVRFKFINETMMAHPVHLHGMFMQLENGQPIEKLPNKHTVIVPPGKTVTTLLTADESGEWAFHCHLLYHMLSGMMTTVIVGKPSEHLDVNIKSESINGGHHHAH